MKTTTLFKQGKRVMTYLMTLAVMLLLCVKVDAQTSPTSYPGGPDTIMNSDSRFFTTIVEKDNGVVELQVMAIGHFKAGSHNMVFTYDPAVVYPTEGPGGIEISNEMDYYDNDPAAMAQFEAFCQWNYTGWDYSGGFIVPDLNAIMIEPDMGMDGFVYDTTAIAQLYTLYFQKVDVANPLTNTVFNFTTVDPWNVDYDYVTFMGYNTDAVLQAAGAAGSSGIFMIVPELFLMRAASSVMTMDATDPCLTSVTLNGLVTSGDDVIVGSGFIWTESQTAEITIDPYSTNVDINGTTYTMEELVTLAAGSDGQSVEIDGEVFYFKYSKSFNDAITWGVTGLTPDVTYTYWAFTVYEFETSIQYPIIGDPVNFTTTSSPNLALTQVVSLTPTCNGSDVTFTITLTNNDPTCTYSNIVLEDIFGAGMTFVSATASIGTFDETTHLWEAITLAPDETATLDVTVTVENLTQSNIELYNTVTLISIDGILMPETLGDITSVEVINNPIVFGPESVSFCVGLTYPIFIDGVATYYTWTGGASVGLDDEDGTNQYTEIPAFNAVNPDPTTHSEYYTATITIIPWYMGGDVLCEGEPYDMEIIISPVARINPEITDFDMCSNSEYIIQLGTSVTELQPTYYFEAYSDNNAAVTVEIVGAPHVPSGYGIRFTTLATTGTANISITPWFDECIGEETIVKVTVLEKPTVTLENKTYCSGQGEVEEYLFGDTTTVKYKWAYVSGNDIPGIPLEGVNIFPAFSPINNSNASYVTLYQVIPVNKANGNHCEGDPRYFTVTVNPTPAIDSIADQTYCNGTAVAQFNFSGSALGATYTWTTLTGSDNIGNLPNNGTGFIPAFTATNTTDHVLTATITVTASYINNNEACGDTTQTFMINVLPTLTVPNVTNFVYCNDTLEAEDYTFGNADDIEYKWRFIGGNDIPGIPVSGTDTFPAFLPTNLGQVPLTALYEVIPVYTLNDVQCPGTASFFTVTINPLPIVSAVLNQTVCVGKPTNAIIFDGIATHYDWVMRGDIGGGLVSPGFGNIDSFVPTTAGTIKFVVTPRYTSSIDCYGEPIEFSITAQGSASVDQLPNITVCSGANVTIPGFSSSNPNPTYTWSFYDGQNIGGPMGSGTGNFPSFEAFNDGINTISATYKVTAGVCDETPMYFTITVNPTPHLDPVTNKAYCSETVVDQFNFSGTVPGTIYVWEQLPGGDIVGNLPGSGTGFIPSFTTVINTTNSTLTAHFMLTATYNNNGVACGGETQEFTISVLPTPTVTGLENKEYCNGSPANIYQFTGVATEWRWEQVDGPSIGMGINNGINEMPSFMASNQGTTPIMATYQVTPVYMDHGIECLGTAHSFTITVYPTIILNAIQEEQVYCNKTNVAEYIFKSNIPNGVTYKWEQIGGVSIGDLPTEGYGSMPAFTTQNYTENILTAKYRVTATFAGSNLTCPGMSKEFSINVLPTPTVTGLENKEYCNGSYVNAYLFTGVATEWRWEQVDGPSIGMGMNNGVSVMPSFMASNQGTTPITATYQVTPVYADNNIECLGTPHRFTITVYPTIILNAIQGEQIYCNKTNVAEYIFKSNIPNGVTYKWEQIGGVSIGDLPTEGYGSMPAFTTQNNTAHVITAEYRVTATFAGSNTTCPEVSKDFSITVMPSVIVDETILTNLEVCNGELVEISFDDNPATTYTWTFYSGMPIGSGLSGSDIMRFKATNPDATPRTATFKVEPSYAYNGHSCPSEVYFFSITVDPELEMTNSVSGGAICSGGEYYHALTTDTHGAIFTWTRPAIAGINGGVASSGTGNITETLINTNTTPIRVEYFITLTFGECQKTFDQPIYVTVYPAPMIDITDVTTTCNSHLYSFVYYTTEMDIPMEYILTFDSKALAAGFQNITTYQKLTNDHIVVNMPANVAPAEYNVTISVRAEGCTEISSFPFKINAVQSTIITSQLPSEVSFCAQEPLILTVEAIGEPLQGETALTYRWYHNNAIIPGVTGSTYEVANPTAANSGTYYVEVEGYCGTASSIKFIVKLTDVVIEQKWDDVLFVSNKGTNYSGYQWYKQNDAGDMIAIAKDAVYQSYYASNKLIKGEVYAVKVFYSDGRTVMSCPFTVENAGQQSSTIKLYPNPVAQNSVIYITKDMNAEELIGSRVDVYDISGRRLISKVIDSPKPEITVDLEPGTYVVKITETSGNVQTEKVVVVR